MLENDPRSPNPTEVQSPSAQPPPSTQFTSAQVVGQGDLLEQVLAQLAALQSIVSQKQNVAELLTSSEGRMVEAISKLDRNFEERLATDHFREEQISRLHKELLEHKSDLLGRALRPFVLGIIRLHDNLNRMLEALTTEIEPLTSVRLQEILDGFRDDIEVLLGQNGIVPFREESEIFNPRRQRALKTIPVADPLQVGRIAARLRPGFEQGESILERERVAVLTAQPTPGPQEPGTPPAGASCG